MPHQHNEHHVVCKRCGARWTIEGQQQPRTCIEAECDAGWMDLPMFASKEDADAAAERIAGESVPAIALLADAVNQLALILESHVWDTARTRDEKLQAGAAVQRCHRLRESIADLIPE